MSSDGLFATTADVRNQLTAYLITTVLALFGTFVAANGTNQVVESPLQPPSVAAYPGMGWVNPDLEGARAGVTINGLDGDTATLLQAPAGKPNAITVLHTELTVASNRVGRIEDWDGICLWVRGGGTPSFLRLEWGIFPVHQAIIRTDTKTWRKVHLPWNQWVPRIFPDEGLPRGHLRIRLETEPQRNSFTVSLIDPLGPDHEAPRTWQEMEPFEAKAVRPDFGVLIKDDVITGTTTGITFVAKTTGAPVYGEIGWFGGLDQAKTFLVSSNFWQRFTFNIDEMPRGGSTKNLMRVSIEDYPYDGVWAALSRLHFYKGLTDEAIHEHRRNEPAVKLPADLWTVGQEMFAEWRQSVQTAGHHPRMVVITDSLHSSLSLRYIGKNPDVLHLHTAWSQLARNLRRHWGFPHSSISREHLDERTNRWRAMGESTDPFQASLRLHVLHSPGVQNFVNTDGIAKAKGHSPDVVFVCIGTADAANLSADNYREAMERIVTGLKASGRIVVIISPPPNLEIRRKAVIEDASPLRRSLRFRKICEEIAVRHELPFVDLTLALVHRGTPFAGQHYVAPNLLNRDGHELISDLLFHLLTHEPRETWKRLPEAIFLHADGFEAENYLAQSTGIDPWERREVSIIQNQEDVDVSDAMKQKRLEIEKYMKELDAELFFYHQGVNYHEWRRQKLRRMKEGSNTL